MDLPLCKRGNPEAPSQSRMKIDQILISALPFNYPIGEHIHLSHISFFGKLSTFLGSKQTQQNNEYLFDATARSPI